MNVWDEFFDSDESPLRDDEQEPIEKLRGKLSTMDNAHRLEMIETGYGTCPRHKHQSIKEIRERNTQIGMEIAKAEAKAGRVNPRVDPFCCPTPGYVPPTIKRSGCGLLALIIPALLILSQVIT